jgi:hypothetical protein
VIEQARHVPLRSLPWSESEAAAAIEDVVADGLEHFDVERFWPAHPLDEVRDGHTSLYFGATGMMWGIDYLGRVGATNAQFDFRPLLPRLMEANRAELPATNGAENTRRTGRYCWAISARPCWSFASAPVPRLQT